MGVLSPNSNMSWIGLTGANALNFNFKWDDNVCETLATNHLSVNHTFFFGQELGLIVGLAIDFCFQIDPEF